MTKKVLSAAGLTLLLLLLLPKPSLANEGDAELIEQLVSYDEVDHHIFSEAELGRLEASLELNSDSDLNQLLHLEYQKGLTRVRKRPKLDIIATGQYEHRKSRSTIPIPIISKSPKKKACHALAQHLHNFCYGFELELKDDSCRVVSRDEIKQSYISTNRLRESPYVTYSDWDFVVEIEATCR